MNWLLVLAPFVVALATGIGFVVVVRRLLPKASARGGRSVVRWLRIPAAFVVGVVAAAGLVMIVGALMPRTHTATRSARYAAAPEAVWTVVSDFETQQSWLPRSVRRLPDRNGHPVWNVFGRWSPGIPYDVEIFELEISAFFVWLSMPPGTALVDAENAIKSLDLEVEIFDPPRRMCTRVLDDDIPFGGTWTWELSPEEGGCRVRITEEGFVESAVLRYLARAAGHGVTMEEHLKALGQRLGEQTGIDT